ncbi:hypothetical protein Tco_1297678 [Tanacetum coccineum]
MATQSSSTSAGVGSTNTPTIVEGSCRMAQLRLIVSKFLKHESNSTLRMHTGKYGEGLKSVPEAVNDPCHKREYFCIRGGAVSTTICKLCDSRRFCRSTTLTTLD